MASSRVFHGCKVMLAAAKVGTPKSSSVAAAEITKPVGRKPKVSPSPSSKSTSTSPSKTSKPAVPRTQTRPSGIQKPSPVSPALNDFVGAPEISRAEAVKKIWDYIKLHNLQDPTNRREVHCDDKLKTIFAGKEKVGIMEISKLLSAHFVKPVKSLSAHFGKTV